MVDERRRDPRARSVGVVRCESATGRKLVSRWLDLGSGGLFVETDEPPTAGTLLTLEIEIPGERAAASAAGRVTWVREGQSSDGKPPGMGVAFIDVDDAVRASIGRFVARESLSEAQAQSPKALPSRERTVLGVGLSAKTPAAAASPRAPMPSREKTVLGVAPRIVSGPAGQRRRLPLDDVDDLPEWPDEPPEPAKAAPPAAAPAPRSQLHVDKGAAPEAERSLPIDLVSGHQPGEPGARRRSPKRESPPIDPSVPRRRSTRGGVGAFVFLFLVLTLAAGGYVYRARLWPWIARYGAFRTALAPVAPTPIATPGGSSLPSTAAGVSATAIALAASPSATAKIEVDAGARPAALDASAGVGITKAPTHPPAPHAPKHRPAVATPAAADVQD
jgi:type IV pilus assembly protein PilZ